MKRVFLIIIFSIIIFPCFAQLSINTNIDGYYVNHNFRIWKIFTEENITYLEPIAENGFYINQIFTVIDKKIDDNMMTLSLIGKPDRDNPNPGANFECIIYKEGNNIYLDEKKRTTREVINGVANWKTELKKRNEYRRYNIDYQSDYFETMQDISFSNSGSFYYKGNILVITPKYPIMEIVSVRVNDNFIVQSVDIGNIEYKNRLLHTDIAIEENLLDNNFFNSLSSIDLHPYHYWGNTKDLILPQVGDVITKIKQQCQEIKVKYFDFSADDIVEKYNNSLLIQFKKKNYILKNGVIIDSFPRSGETEEIQIVDQNNEETIVEYYNTERYDYSKKVILEIIYSN